eukprot:COSAG01_NODE_3197_length_6430_cov_36.427263_6_plen_149_part_00
MLVSNHSSPRHITQGHILWRNESGGCPCRTDEASYERSKALLAVMLMNNNIYEDQFLACDPLLCGGPNIQRESGSGSISDVPGSTWCVPISLAAACAAADSRVLQARVAIRRLWISLGNQGDSCQLYQFTVHGVHLLHRHCPVGYAGA